MTTPQNGYYIVDLRSLGLSNDEHSKIEAAVKNAVMQTLSSKPGAAPHKFESPPGGVAGMFDGVAGSGPK